MRSKSIASIYMWPVVIFAVIMLGYGQCHVAIGVTTSVWTSQTQEDFRPGKPKDVSVSSKGEVSLSRKLESLAETEESYIWCLAEDSQGNLYAGTGNDGKIFRITQEGESSLFFDSPEVSIHSLAIDSADNVYAGTSPDGLVYRISPDGQATTLLKGKEKYVWALVMDETGNLYAGTGTDGKIYKITPAGEVSVLFDSEETHIMCLLYANGTLYAGSEGSGIIYKITSDGQAFVVYEIDEKEIHNLAMDSQGNLYAAATTGKMPGEGQPQLGAPPSPPAATPAEKESRKSSIYQVTPGGAASKIWTSKSPLILSMVMDDSNLVVGTGNEGMIYAVTSDKESASLAKCEEMQVLSIHRSSASAIFVATGNAGKIYRLSAEHPEEGMLESKPNDANIISQWGIISWEYIAPKSTSISFASRTGNSSKPDKTWSKWSEEYTDASGQKITSPPARFIQWRAKLTTTETTVTPLLKRVDVAYMQENIEPEIVSIQIDGEAEEKKPASPAGPPSALRPSASESSTGGGKRTIQWKAVDPNDDSMEYTIYYRSVDEQRWKLMEEEYLKSSYSWDSTAMPDGRYEIRIVANDRLSNPASMAKTAEEISDPFEIDNTSPAIGDIVVLAAEDDAFQVTFTVEDKMSRIKGAEFSIDGQKWEIAFPADNLFDAKEEKFSFTIPSELEPGEHTVVVKVTDAASNISAGRQVFTK